MIYLASHSPRRAQLLAQIAEPFSLLKVVVEEQRKAAELAEDYVQRLALEKAQAGFAHSDQTRFVLGADTIVVIAGQVLEKPLDRCDAKRMLQLLSGNTHQVFTAIALVGAPSEKIKLVKTDVTFRVLSEQDIDEYWLTGEPLDKAAGYAIQGVAGEFVTNINGSYSAVVGLPLYETKQLIKELKGIECVC